MVPPDLGAMEALVPAIARGAWAGAPSEQIPLARPAQHHGIRFYALDHRALFECSARSRSGGRRCRPPARLGRPRSPPSRASVPRRTLWRAGVPSEEPWHHLAWKWVAAPSTDRSVCLVNRAAALASVPGRTEASTVDRAARGSVAMLLSVAAGWADFWTSAVGDAATGRASGVVLSGPATGAARNNSMRTIALTSSTPPATTQSQRDVLEVRRGGRSRAWGHAPDDGRAQLV